MQRRLRIGTIRAEAARSDRKAEITAERRMLFGDLRGQCSGRVGHVDSCAFFFRPMPTIPSPDSYRARQLKSDELQFFFQLGNFRSVIELFRVFQLIAQIIDPSPIFGLSCRIQQESLQGSFAD